MKANNPLTTMAMPTTCPPRSVSPSSRNDHTTARAGCATWAIPIVPIGIVFCANTISPWAATPMSEREDQHVCPSRAAQAEHVAVGDRQRKHGHGCDRTDRRHERGDVHVAAKVSRRHDVGRPQQHREHAEHVAPQRRVPIGGRAEQHDGHAAERDEREHQRARIDVLVEERWRRSAR